MKNTFPVSHSAVESDKFKALAPVSKILFYTLCKNSNRFGTRRNGWFNRSTRELADDSGLSLESVVKGRKELEENCFIETHTAVDYRRHLSTEYHICNYKQLKNYTKK